MNHNHVAVLEELRQLPMMVAPEGRTVAEVSAALDAAISLAPDNQKYLYDRWMADERCARAQDERDALRSEIERLKTDATSLFDSLVDAQREIGRLEAAIDKVLALPLMNHKTECRHCGHFTDTFAADTEAIRVALTQKGEGS